MDRSAEPDLRRLVTFDWIIRLRWLVAALQTVAFLVAWVAVTPSLRLGPVFGVIAVGVLTNVYLAVGWRDREASEALLFGILLIDTGLLTTLLALTGGASNPFGGLYLVVAGLGALILRPWGTWALVAIAAAAYGSLYVMPHRSHSAMWGHLVGMWVSFLGGAVFLAYAIQRLRALLAIADAEVGEARRMAERSGRLAALGTLAAGAAHELATPLSTVAVVAGELARHADEAVREDGQLVAAQVARCQDILSDLSADAGTGRGEGARRVAVAELVAVAVGDRVGVDVEIAADVATAVVVVPEGLVAQAFRRLLGNALLASPPGARVTVRAREDRGGIALEVEDEGPGMSPEDLARAGEPFFTTRPPGQGTGLGLFFARSVVEQLGGHLELDSAVGRGTRAALWLPRDRGGA